MNLRLDVSKQLIARGFQREGRTHRLYIDQDWWFLVDIGPFGKRADIAPFVGIRHDRIERLVQELLSLPKDEWSGTVGANVGYILGIGYQWWEPPSQPEKVLLAIDQAINRFRPLLSLERLPEAWLIDGTRAAPGWQYSEIAAFFLRGEINTVMEKLEKARITFCENQNEVCDQFNEFERRIIARLNSRNFPF